MSFALSFTGRILSTIITFHHSSHEYTTYLYTLLELGTLTELPLFHRDT